MPGQQLHPLDPLDQPTPRPRRRRPRPADPIQLPAARARVLVRARDAIAAWAPQAVCRKAAQALAPDDLERRRALTGQFFPTRHSTPEQISDAKLVCGGCPVRPECLAYSLVNWERGGGIWGGETEDERRRSRRRMRRAGVRGRDMDGALEWVLDQLYPTKPEPNSEPISTEDVA